MVTITAFLDGDIVIDRRLAGIADRIADMRPVYPELARLFRSITARAFATEGASTASGPWAPLTPRTVADRRRQGYPGEHPILQRSSALRRSLTELTGDTILVETPSYFAIGSADPNVAFHQSTSPRTKLPRRPLVDLTSDDKHRLFLPLRRHVTGSDPSAPTRGRIG